MQSGVIPVALMKGTPVVATGIEGLTEWLQDLKTGVIVPPDPSVAEIKAAISYIRAHFDEIIGSCREYYLATFDDGWIETKAGYRGSWRHNRTPSCEML